MVPYIFYTGGRAIGHVAMLEISVLNHEGETMDITQERVCTRVCTLLTLRKIYAGEHLNLSQFTISRIFPDRGGYRGADSSLPVTLFELRCWAQWHWYFTHFKLLFSKRNRIRPMNRSVCNAACKPKASYRTVQYECACRYTPNNYSPSRRPLFIFGTQIKIFGLFIYTKWK